MAAHFSNAEWNKINSAFDQSAELFGLPKRRKDSVVIGTFNIRKLGRVSSRTTHSWQLLTKIIDRFDLIAIQEVMDDLSGLEHLQDLLGSNYGLVVSDVTGAKPGKSGNTERLAFLFNWKRVQRSALASDITYDRTEISNNLYDNRSEFSKAWTKHKKNLDDWLVKVEANNAQRKKAPRKPAIELPKFLSFIRQPHCVSFRVPGKNSAKPYEFLIVNAHLLYGTNKKERQWEFWALIEWLTIRAKYITKLYHPNLILLGDCNLDFDDSPGMRIEIDSFLKGLNKSVLKSKKAATANFPLLSPHPSIDPDTDSDSGFLKSALRQKETYDQIAIFSHDKRLPDPPENSKAGESANGFDYGVFNIGNLLANSLHGESKITKLTKSKQKAIYKKAEFDISDHMPAWIRLPIPR